MARQRSEYAATSWADVAQCVPAWEREYGVYVEVRIRFRQDLADFAYLEVTLCDADEADHGRELMRVRHPFPAQKASGQAGAVLYAIFEAFNTLSLSPWQYSVKMRREVVEEM